MRQIRSGRFPFGLMRAPGLDGPLNDQIILWKRIGTSEASHGDHFGGPEANAFDAEKCFDCFFWIRSRLESNLAVPHPPRQLADGLAPGSCRADLIDSR